MTNRIHHSFLSVAALITIACGPTIAADSVQLRSALPATPACAAARAGAVPIHAVQGSGDVSPLLGLYVTVEGVVVGDFDGPSQLGGVFIQEEDVDADADPTTSEGIFVFVTHRGSSLAVGERARVRGVVSERFGRTSLESITVCQRSAGAPSPTPTPLTFPLGHLEQPEQLEGMLVTLPQTMTVATVGNLGRWGTLTVSWGRAMAPTQIAAPGAAALAVRAKNLHRRILLDDGLSTVNPDPVRYPSPGLSASNTLRSGDEITGLQGIVDYGFGAYRIQPTETVSITRANPRPTSPVLASARLRVGFLNVRALFNGDGMGGGFPTPFGASDPVEYQRQLNKIVAAVVAMDADIVGIAEIDDDGVGPNSAMADLVKALNDKLSVYQRYESVNPGSQLGAGIIAVGLLYRPTVVQTQNVAAVLDQSMDPRFRLGNRPVVAQTFLESATGEVMTVAVAHLKSKGSSCDFVGDPDLGDGQANCNVTRTLAAHAIVDWLAADPTGVNDSDYLLVGDLNVYALEDPLKVLKSGGFQDLMAAYVPPVQAYSANWDSQFGYIDHALASASLRPQIADATFFHINIDEPVVLDYNLEFKSAAQQAYYYAADAYRASDHDAVVVAVDLF